MANYLLYIIIVYYHFRLLIAVLRNSFICTQLLRGIEFFILNFAHNLQSILCNSDGENFIQKKCMSAKFHNLIRILSGVAGDLCSRENGDINWMRLFGRARDILVVIRDALPVDEVETHLLAETWHTYIASTLVFRPLQRCDAVPQAGRNGS